MRKVDVIILAGGFAKRMWPLTKDRPKHLLDIAGRPMLCHTIEPLLELDEIGRIFISTNRAFEEQFRDLIRSYYPDADLELMIEPTLEEGQKLGSVGGLGYLIREKQLSNDTMIIGGDNLFEFSHLDALEAFRKQGKDIVAVYDVLEREKASLYGIVGIDEENIIERFVEKPADPPSTLAATAYYIFRGETIGMIVRYLDEGGKPDALGHFITYLVERRPVYAWSFPGRWFDVGSLDSYKEADNYFGSR